MKVKLSDVILNETGGEDSGTLKPREMVLNAVIEVSGVEDSIDDLGIAVVCGGRAWLR
jgi:hypothetical protein